MGHDPEEGGIQEAEPPAADEFVDAGLYIDQRSRVFLPHRGPPRRHLADVVACTGTATLDLYPKPLTLNPNPYPKPYFVQQ